MSSRKKRIRNCVTREECAQISGQLREELMVIKEAIVGKDLRGGIVADVADIKQTLKNRNRETAVSMKWRLTVMATCITSGTLIVVELIRALLQR